MIITDPDQVDSDTIVLEYENEVVFSILVRDYGMLKWLQKKFTYRISNWQFNPKVKAGVWDGKISFVNLNTFTIPIGLLDRVVEEIESAGYKLFLNIEKKDFRNNFLTYDAISAYCKKVMKSCETFEWDERDYQVDCVYRCLKFKRGIIEASVGAGKSWIIYIIIRWLIENETDTKIILVVPTTMLVDQMVTDWHDYGWTIPELDDTVEILYAGEQPTFDKKVLVTTWQSVYKKPQSFFEKYTTLLFDEAHTAQAESLLAISKKTVNCRYRLGFTGTMPEEVIEMMNVIAYLGDIRKTITTKFLQGEGVLSDLRILIINLIYPPDVTSLAEFFGYAEMMDFIAQHGPRMDALTYFHKQYVKDHQNTLILVQRRSHVLALQERFEKIYGKARVKVIKGGVDSKERQTIRKSLETENGVILIGTYQTMSTGVNIKNLHFCFFASPYKAKAKVLQSIGRILRTHASKTVAYLFDFVDVFGVEKDHTKRQKGKRIQLYSGEGYPYKEIDIDMAQFGASRKFFDRERKSVWKK